MHALILALALTMGPVLQTPDGIAPQPQSESSEVESSATNETVGEVVVVPTSGGESSVSNEERFRNWLQTYRIYFELGSMLLLPALGGVIAFQANRIAETQTQMLARQTDLAEAGAAPLIHVLVRRTYDAESEGIDTESLEISNLGEPARNVEIDLIVFLVVHPPILDENSPPPDSVSVVLNDYYETIELTGEAVGLLAGATGPSNFAYVRYAASQPLASLDGARRFRRFELRRYVAATFVDSVGNNRREYLTVGDFGARLIRSDEGERIVATAQEMRARGSAVNMDDLVHGSLNYALSREEEFRQSHRTD